MKLSTPLFDLYSNSVKSGEKPRIYIVVGTTISKKAVDRNLIKRRVRAVLKGLEVSRLIRTVKIIAKPPILLAKFSDIKKTIELNWPKIL